MKQTICAILLMAVLSLTRIPGLTPVGFSAVIALIFCAGVYLPQKIGWFIIFPMLLATDVALDYHYGAPLLSLQMLPNYTCYVLIFWFGQRFSAKDSCVKLLSGGLLGAVIFYLVTNTIAFFQNPEYAKNLAGWLQALTTGIPGFPPTWMFFRNSLLGTGLFGGLFVAAMKFSESLAEKQSQEEEEKDDDEAEEPAEKEESCG